MKVTGIIAEYNPFHNGHKYQIDKARETGTDYIIVAMSGNFTQRGEPAIFNKYTRTEMALLNGADLVLELPVMYAVSDAGRFARGGVSLLNSLGVVNELSFGIEEGCEKLCFTLSDFLSNPPQEYSAKIREELKKGNSYPVSRMIALSDYFDVRQLELISGSNMILALEYLQAIKSTGSSILPLPLKRIGAAYNDASLDNDGFSSASGIREVIRNRNSQQLNHNVPPNILGLMENSLPVYSDDFSSLLHYKLVTEDDFTGYLNIDQSFSDRVNSLKLQYTDINSFVDLLKTKNITRTSVMRLLSHILLNMTSVAPVDVPYARILGFRKESEPLLSAIKQSSSIPMISKLADADMCSCLKADIQAADIYNSVVTNITGNLQKNEYTNGIVII